MATNSEDEYDGVFGTPTEAELAASEYLVCEVVWRGGKGPLEEAQTPRRRGEEGGAVSGSGSGSGGGSGSTSGIASGSGSVNVNVSVMRWGLRGIRLWGRSSGPRFLDLVKSPVVYDESVVCRWKMDD